MADAAELKPSLADYVFDYAKETPDRIALASEYGQMTYAELAPHVRRVGEALLRAGVQRGDRVAMLTTPRADAYAIFVALNAIGAIWVGINRCTSTARCNTWCRTPSPSP